MTKLRFIDLFAGMGGMRKGFELACEENGIDSECVLTSEIKPHAIEVLRANYADGNLIGDITKADVKKIPDFDVLLAGFPCQAFSAAGKRLGFDDARGTLFFEVARILKEKQPAGFLLENVEGLVNHDKSSYKDSIGRTFRTILDILQDLGYHVSWRILNACDFGVPQNRKRICITGTLISSPCLESFDKSSHVLEDILETDIPVSSHPFVRKLLQYYSVDELIGKSVKDKRGGDNNIHSWDIELKGSVSEKQKRLLSVMMTERRKKKWAGKYGIDWMDGMPLTLEMIRSFWNDEGDLYVMLEDLTAKRYLVKEYPKMKLPDGRRIQDTSLPFGYNIVAGKMSYEVAEILNPKGVAPTLVATDMMHLYVPDSGGIRRLTPREGLRLFGYPEDYRFPVSLSDGYDLLGNTVCVPVIKSVSERLLRCLT